METSVVKYIYIKLGSLLDILILMRGGAVSEKQLMTLFMTLVLLSIPPLMDSNPKLGKIRSLEIICAGIGLITISLHCANTMKILMNVP